MRRAWRWWGVWVVLVVCLCCAAGAPCECTDDTAKARKWNPEGKGEDWTWWDRSWCVRTRPELEEVLRDHEIWWKNHQQGKRADLSGTYLGGADLGARNLNGARLIDVFLKDADLHKADLVEADLKWSDLILANLSQAYLTQADLTEAKLEDANLKGADLIGVKLTGAYLTGADLSDSELYGAMLSGVTYEPKSSPPAQNIAYADGLDRLIYYKNPAPLVSLRKSFQDGGFVQQGRSITAALRRHDESWPERVLFDWTCAWGADWSHPLVLLGWLCLVCGPIYWVGMHFGRVGGIYQIVLDTTVVTKASKELVTRVETGVRWGGRPALRTRTFGQRERRVQTQIPYGNDKKERQEPKQGQTQISCEKDEQRAEEDLRSPRKRVRRPGSGWGRVGPVLRAEWRALRLAFLFSVLSALDIGFHEFNVGVWARMLLARDFNLKARGWMRVAGGAQSLVGLGLVALSLLSYFGHPFD